MLQVIDGLAEDLSTTGEEGVSRSGSKWCTRLSAFDTPCRRGALMSRAWRCRLRSGGLSYALEKGEHVVEWP